MIPIRPAIFVALGLAMAVGVAGDQSPAVGLANLDLPLLQAAGEGDTAAVRQLLKHRPNLEAKDEGGATPLILAAERGHIEIVNLLLQKGANLEAADSSEWTALVHAAYSANTGVLEALLKHSPSFKNKNEALLAAATSGPVEMFVIPAEGGVQEDAKQKAPAEIPDSDWVKTVKLLLASGADIEARAENGDTPLIRAAGHGQTDIVRLLLEKGANVEATDQGGDNALVAAACICAIASMNDTFEIEKMLLEKRGKLAAKDEQGGRALLAAVGWGRNKNAELMLDHGADIETRDDEGNTPLILAATPSAVPTLEAVQLLLSRGAKVEARNHQGNTALMLAASEEGYEDMAVIKLLLSKGASVTAKNSEGATALSLARKNGREEIVALLEKAIHK